MMSAGMRRIGGAIWRDAIQRAMTHDRHAECSGVIAARRRHCTGYILTVTHGIHGKTPGCT
jgi:hypothetical protein